MSELQVIPARHGTATFVPAGSVIKIVNTSGTQVVDTWAFALPKPDGPKKGSQEEKTAQEETKKAKSTPAKKKGTTELPSQEDAENATNEGVKGGEEANATAMEQKKTWSSYVPSIGWSSGKKDPAEQAEQQKDSKTWSSYFPSGKGFSTYIPSTAKDTVSSFAQTHQRDPNKSYLEQLTEFSKTPVGAAGLSVLSGSGYGGSVYAGYQAWNASKALAPQMEFMSMPHCRAASCHLRPRVNDTLVSNVRQPVLTMVEDTSGGVHDTLIAACDPSRYKGLGVENWEQHGSCAENLILALKELNERAGLKGNKAVGAELTVNSVPAPLNLFMNIPWDEDGDVSFASPKSKKGGFVRMKAERDVVVVMSACPQDVLDINAKKPTDAHFVVEGEEDTVPAIKRTQVRKRPPPRKLSSSHATSTVASETGTTPAYRPSPRKAPAKKLAANTSSQATEGAKPAPSQPAKKYVPKKVVPKSASRSNSATAANAEAPAKKATANVTRSAANSDAAAKKPAANGTNAADSSTPAASKPDANAIGAADSSTAVPEKKKPRKLKPKTPAPAAES